MSKLSLIPDETERLKQEKMLEREKIALERKQNKTSQLVEDGTRLARFEEETMKICQRTAEAAEEIARHTVSTRTIEFTAAYTLEAAVQDLKTQIAKSMADQESYRVDRKYREMATILGGSEKQYILLLMKPEK